MESLNAGEPVIHENGLQDLLEDAGNNITFTTSLPGAVLGTDVVIMAVGRHLKVTIMLLLHPSAIPGRLIMNILQILLLNLPVQN